ncbi:MAG: helix-turn-helix domain-containing protein, partial [Polyangiales bacterium]
AAPPPTACPGQTPPRASSPPPADTPPDDKNPPPARLPPLGAVPCDLDQHLAQIEKKALLQALHACGGVRTEAAKHLGMSFRSLRYRLAKYQLAEEGGEAADARTGA